MTLTVSRRFVYDDVALLASTDPTANGWRLEVERGEATGWLLVHAKIVDSHMNWSTPDLALWGVLRQGEPSAIHETFPDSSPSVPAGPFAVAWDVSNWYPWPHPTSRRAYRFRFTDPAGNLFEFHLRSSTGGHEHVFG